MSQFCNKKNKGGYGRKSSNVIISSIDPNKVLKNLAFCLSPKFVYYIYIHMVLEDYSLFICVDCGNEFLTLELPLGINDPQYCPFCGIDFLEIEGMNEFNV